MNALLKTPDTAHAQPLFTQSASVASCGEPKPAINVIRRASKPVTVRDVIVGGTAPVSVQSMLTGDTCDIQESITQIKRLAEAGCEIMRLAVPNKEAAEALKTIVPASPIPIVADIHFDYRLALQAAENGVDALRVNPGNLSEKDFIRQVARKAKALKLPIRVGVNSGSVEKPVKAQYPDDRVRQLVESALLNVRLLEDEGFDDIVISVKASDPLETIAAYRQLAPLVPYALHLGVTEAGTLKRGLVKSAFALGTLLLEGIGDTIRVSLTADSIEEVFAGHEILRSVGLRNEGVNLISCPSCGRCEVDLHGLANAVETMVAKIETPMNVAVMGCFVNGPGEAGHADVGIAGGKGQYYIFRGEERVKKVAESEALEAFAAELAEVEAEKRLAAQH
ncbi:MAG: flavodoxin-dependent (E)-4-hydroxy-3-methylbut-2-enyl-diphosphate synthase [Vampirovibrionales bacterium]|nr:flavodoxin-dependent (E)-4-hydroxy-3-methylbut-2-enyl-diphosphate synthase [Vampirovibrionales bacterium]